MHFKCQSLHCVQLSAASWTVACQASPATGFSKQERWSGLPFPSLGDLANPGNKPDLLHCRRILNHLIYQGSPALKSILNAAATITIIKTFPTKSVSSVRGIYPHGRVLIPALGTSTFRRLWGPLAEE